MFDSKLIHKQQRWIKEILRTKYQWVFDEIHFLNNGVVNLVYLVNEASLGEIAIRTPGHINKNDISSLKKEALLYDFCHRHNFPVPKPYLLHSGEHNNFLASEYINTDGSNVSSHEIGRLVSLLHSLPIDNLSIVGQGHVSFTKVISLRIINRLHKVNETFNIKMMIPNACLIQSILDSSVNGVCLLHLDIRNDNIICRNHKVKALIDWDNAYIGDPIAEIMRVSESNELNIGEFLEGYQNDHLIQRTSKLIQQIYRLDTALMLTLLFKIELKDNRKSEYYLKRVKSLTNFIYDIIL
ncbi:phosphotransferase [Alkalihalobacillus pseudalcaliphilus]|uniref:phosphotransferase n=1 Tax=Alkalihalobacillus pseudalcaliphilus TaxID=79884 RepID=UPI00064DFC7E|nr:phosphotransferase [Alkalihalobacillus pseudalcaliphilus]KMK75618.1 hypothetical protein AB990_10055 [Alkalihalobacillus pseudalcaliphilus]